MKTAHFKVTVKFELERTGLSCEDAEYSVRAAICEGMGWGMNTPMHIMAVYDEEKIDEENS